MGRLTDVSGRPVGADDRRPVTDCPVCGTPRSVDADGYCWCCSKILRDVLPAPTLHDTCYCRSCYGVDQLEEEVTVTAPSPAEVACPFCATTERPHHVGGDEYACRACKRPFVWFLSTDDYLTAITASRPALLVGELLHGPQVVPVSPPHRTVARDRGAIETVQDRPDMSSGVHEAIPRKSPDSH
jgi:hypothetical protein